MPQLDIYDKVGFGSAHDEYIEFTVDGSTLYWRGEISEIKGNLIRVDFIKVYSFNCKVYFKHSLINYISYKYFETFTSP